MIKLIVSFGIILCSMMFFLGGALVGYQAYDSKQTVIDKNEKPIRKPNETIGQVFSKVIDTTSQDVTSRIRVPSIPAIEKARSYTSNLR